MLYTYVLHVVPDISIRGQWCITHQDFFIITFLIAFKERSALLSNHNTTYRMKCKMTFKDYAKHFRIHQRALKYWIKMFSQMHLQLSNELQKNWSICWCCMQLRKAPNGPNCPPLRESVKCFMAFKTWGPLLLPWLVCLLIMGCRINTRSWKSSRLLISKSPPRKMPGVPLVIIFSLPNYHTFQSDMVLEQLYLNWSDIPWELQNRGCQNSKRDFSEMYVIGQMHATSEQVKDFRNRSCTKVVMGDYSRRLCENKIRGNLRHLL